MPEGCSMGLCGSFCGWDDISQGQGSAGWTCVSAGNVVEKGGIVLKCIRIAMESNVEKYEVGKGMEDGFELLSDVVTKGWIVTDILVKIKRDNGMIVCPYIMHRRGRTFIGEGDYIITDKDGTRHVCGEDKIFSRYQKIE